MEDRPPASDECAYLVDVGAIYYAHAKKCHAVAVRIVRDPHLAQDVVQEVFASIGCEPGRFDPARGSLSAWLVVLTHHKAVDLVRARQSRTRLDRPEEMAASVADHLIGPEDQVCRDEEGSRVRRAVRQLDRVERQVIVLAYFEGYSQSQIAALIAIPLGTVKSRTTRALHHLAGLLAECSPPRYVA